MADGVIRVGHIVQYRSSNGPPPGLRIVLEILASDPSHETFYNLHDPDHPDEPPVQARRSEITPTGADVDG